MRSNPWSDASYSLEIAFDIAIIVAACLVTWLGFYINALVLALGGGIFIASGLCWLAADMWRALSSVIGFRGWIIDSPVPELGLTFSWSRNSVSACLYLVRVNLVGTIYRRK